MPQDDIPVQHTGGLREVVRQLNNNDVLTGRGALVAAFEGNVQYRKLVQSRKAEYTAANGHVPKQKIADEVYLEIERRKGRFLAKLRPNEAALLGIPAGESAWVVVEKVDAMEKIKQALREKGPSATSRSGSNGNSSTRAFVAMTPSEQSRQHSHLEGGALGHGNGATLYPFPTETWPSFGFLQQPQHQQQQQQQQLGSVGWSLFAAEPSAGESRLEAHDPLLGAPTGSLHNGQATATHAAEQIGAHRNFDIGVLGNSALETAFLPFQGQGQQQQMGASSMLQALEQYHQRQRLEQMRRQQDSLLQALEMSAQRQQLEQLQYQHNALVQSLELSNQLQDDFYRPQPITSMTQGTAWPNVHGATTSSHSNSTARPTALESIQSSPRQVLQRLLDQRAREILARSVLGPTEIGHTASQDTRVTEPFDSVSMTGHAHFNAHQDALLDAVAASHATGDSEANGPSHEEGLNDDDCKPNGRKRSMPCLEASSVPSKKAVLPSPK